MLPAGIFRNRGLTISHKNPTYLGGAVIFIIALIAIGLAIAGAIFFTTRERVRPPSIASPYEPCDVDRDGDCDGDDFNLITQFIGQCRDDENYNTLADADHDGCVTEADRQKLFFAPKTGILPQTRGEPRELCDLNFDEQCDATDVQIFTMYLGKCRGDQDYSIISDADLDGCITEADRPLLFPRDQAQPEEKLTPPEPSESLNANTAEETGDSTNQSQPEESGKPPENQETEKNKKEELNSKKPVPL